MSPNLHDNQITPVQIFRGVDGNLISLDETTDRCRYTDNSGVIKFVLRNDRKFSFVLNFVVIIFVAALCATTDPTIPIGLYAILLIFQCKHFISSVNIDTLLVVESVGVQIIGKRAFSSGESSKFLPWNTIQDVFINEVITGQRVLYYLTFLVRESIGGRETTKLVPLFNEIRPERKCLEYINTEGFAYPKELTKVIRRILKSQPRQGQQFGTRHLLVTYNHSSWMRQDKMFAMLKFRERSDATAFPHAFVLTVQTLNDSSSEEQPKDKSSTNMKSNTAKDERVSMTDVENEEIAENNAPQRQTDNCDISKSKTDDQIEKFDKNISDKSGDSSTSSLSRESDTERKKDPGKKATGSRKSSGNVEYLSRNKARNRGRYTSSEKRKNDIPPDSPAEKAIAADFADLPYQYIIEKEIERTKGSSAKHSSNRNEKESSPGRSHKESDLPGKSLPRSPRAAQAETARSADITDLVMEGLMCTIRQDHDSVTVVEQKTKLEMDEVLENSEKAETKEGEKCLLNSSLLRLENLITKIEMSEARSKCHEDRAKSSRLIANDTMIKKSFAYNSPVNGASFEHGIHARNYDTDIDRTETPEKSKSSNFSFQQIERSPITDMPKFPLVKINLGNVREVLSDKLRYYEHMEVPEAAEAATDEAMEIDRNVSIIKDTNESTDWEMGEIEEEDEVGIELKYDEKDDSQPDKSENDNGEKEQEIISETVQSKIRQDISDDFATSGNQRSAECDKSSCDNQTVKNSPRIISNKIVTVDEIPPAMQKALNDTRLRRKRLSEEYEIIVRDKTAVEESIPNVECTTPSKSMFIPLHDHTLQNETTNEKIVDVTEESKREFANEKTRKPSTRRKSLRQTKDVADADGSKEPEIYLDITEEFQREFANEKTRKPTTRRKSLRRIEDVADTDGSKEPEVYMDMWKFMQDITNGVKVVVHRLDITDIPNGIAQVSSVLK